tara:strand:+ start:1674 stop:1988 length:315 start_codon:yes stop_codon:yes gene_type:complete
MSDDVKTPFNSNFRDTWNTVVDLNLKLERLIDSIESIKEKQEEMAVGIEKIKEAVYNPDQGIYARLKELENWKNSSSKVIWMLVASIVGLSTATLWAQIVAGGG